MEPDEHMDERGQYDVLMPGLPDDLALQCLARIPRGHYAVCAQVSRSWRRLIMDKYPEVVEMRRRFGIFEDWPFVLLEGPRDFGRVWMALDPVTLQWITLPPLAAEESFHTADKECFVAGRNLLVVGIHTKIEPPNYNVHTEQIIWYYDVDMNVWTLAPAMRVRRCLFASASTGNYGYVAGGTIFGADGRVSNVAERFNSDTKSWENLPNMNYERKYCSGFIMDNRFYVIGGMNTQGEYYDPATSVWTTVDNFWPVGPRALLGGGAPPLVAVLKDELYALDADTTELKHYDKVTGVWTALTVVPGRAHHESGWGLAFKALDGELWVIGGRSPAGQDVGNILAFKPDPVNGQHVWRRVTNTLNGGSFCLNCAVMKM
ncbi:unnamed protein product [Calypogeia fissa]